MDPADQLRQTLSGGSTKKALRFVLNLLSSTPYIGGVFSAAASAWAETEQDKVNRLLFIVQQLTDDRVTEIEGSLALASNPTHLVAASLTFNPNTGEFIDGFNVSSLADCGTLDFAVGFAGDLARYVFTCYGSGPVSIERVNETSSGLRVVFRHPAPDKVTIAFFEEQPNNGLHRTAASRNEG
jgi:hypothetical protein